MRLHQLCLVAPLIVVLAVPHPVLAQIRHAVEPDELASLVTEHVDKAAASRQAIREALDRPEVRETAGRLGLDMDQLLGQAAALQGADLEYAAAAARDVSDALVGGQSTVVISTTTIIIILLLVLVIVAVAD